MNPLDSILVQLKLFVHLNRVTNDVIILHSNKSYRMHTPLLGEHTRVILCSTVEEAHVLDSKLNHKLNNFDNDIKFDNGTKSVPAVWTHIMIKYCI